MTDEKVERVEMTPADVVRRRYEGLLEISNLVGSVMELEDIFHKVVEIVLELFDSQVCSIYLLGPRRKNLTLRATVGAVPDVQEYIGQAKLPLGRGLPGIAAETNELIMVPDASEDPRHESVHPLNADEEHHAYICCPLRMQETVIGVMTARRDESVGYSEEDCMLFETICKQVAIVIEKARMYREKTEADRLAAVSISLSEVAHYIKNLLQNTKGGSYFVDTGLKRGDLDMTRQGWDVLKRANRKIAGLVENMLNYGRDMELKTKPYQINALIYEILQTVDDSAIERNVALMPMTHRNLPKVEIDYEKIYDALLNLITNAIDAIPEDNTNGLVLIHSRLSENGHYVEVAVEDNGAGMPPDVQERIWNLFFSTKGEKGSGIGLSVTRKIIEKHNGQIEVESEVGKGTTFTMRLPVPGFVPSEIEPEE